jgi:hypothetical protein
MMTCSVMVGCECFRGSCYFHLCHTIPWRHNPENCVLKPYCHENLKFHKMVVCPQKVWNIFNSAFLDNVNKLLLAT